MDTAPSTVSPTPEVIVPLVFSGMDRVCPCPGHPGQPQQQPTDLEMQVMLQECGAASAEITLDDGSCQVPDGESRSGWYTSQLGFDGPDWEGPTPPYYGGDWPSDSEGASDVEGLDTVSVEVSVDEDDLASRQAEALTGQW